MGCGSTVEVSTFQVKSTEEIPDLLGKTRIDSPAQSLACNNTTVAFVSVKWSQDPWQCGSRPAHVVVGEYSDRSAYLGDCPSHLASFIRMGDREESNAVVEVCRHCFQHLLGILAIGFDRDE